MIKNRSLSILFGLVAAGFIGAGIMSSLANRLKNLPPTQSRENSADKNLLQQASLEEIKDRLQTSKTPLTLVNLWASWCRPCKVEFPGLLKLRSELKDRGLDLLLISLDHEDQRQDALDFLKSHQVDFLSFIKGSQNTGFMQPLFPMWNGAIPASFLVNRDLQVLEAWIGETSVSEFRAKILSHLPNP